ncbi:hypothetical protein G7Y79_00016g040770 [Physcia stellaris]|nr:hypothetical protein G7Y79_00016g040770 [Physcia stellaris]
MATINRKDTPAPTMHRPNPPASLDLKGAPTNASSYHHSPPLTPPYRIRMKGGRAPRVQPNRPTPRETIGHGLTEGNPSNARGAGGNEPLRKERISHDLSLTENPRHSVVDNMLLSLNPDQPRYVSPPATQRPPLSAGSQLSSVKSVRHRGRLHSSSSASDTVPSVDESPSRFSTQFNRGRRSNSSSNFPTPLGRIDSGKYTKEADSTKRADVFSRQSAGTTDRSSVPGSRAGRKGSKSSGSSSVDFGSMMGGTKWQGPLGRRSSSFDHGHRRQTSSLGSNPPVSMPATLTKPMPSFATDTAVPPIVPSGPRSRDQSPSKQPRATATERPGSNGSTARRLKKHKGDSIEGVGPRAARSGSPEKRGGSEQVVSSQNTPISKSTGKVISRSQSPAGPYQEATSASRQGSISQVFGTSRDRPGFFRRVFGSSRHANNLSHDLRQPLSESSRNSVRADSRTGFNVPNMLNKPDTSNETTHHVLTKKPSSFFRRRKKSISEPVAGPIIPTQAQSQVGPIERPNDMMPEASPASSLWQVMDPFLHHPVTPRRDSSKGPDTGYATITPSSRRPPIKPSYSRQKSLQELDTPRQGYPSGPTSVPRESSSASGNVKSDNTSLRPPSSFLHDDSSNEEKPIHARDNLTPGEPDTQNRDKVTPWKMEADMPPKRTVKTFPPDSASHKENDSRLKSPKTFPLEKPPKPVKAATALASRDLNLTTSSPPRASSKQPGTRDWLTAAHISPAEEKPLPPDPSSSEERMWLQPDKSDEDLSKPLDAHNPTEVIGISPVSAYETALSSPNQPKPDISPVDVTPIREDRTTRPEIVVGECEPTQPDQELAAKIFNGDESLVAKAKAAAWLGDEGPQRARVRRAYMEMFEWQDINILAALRDFCSRLLLKGETQQVDRLLDELSSRWCACNPNHGFKATDVVHTICYSILLLNTDLHMADIEYKMTRAQFLKNTVPTIRRVVADAAPNAFENKRASTLPPAKAWPESPLERPKSPTLTRSSTEVKRSFEGQRPTYRLSQRPSDQSGYAYSNGAFTPLDYDKPTDDCGPLVKAPFHGKMSTWEVQIEIVLKDFYNAIRQQRLPLHATENLEKPPPPEQTPSANSLTAMTGTMLRRTPSMLSKAGSEQLSYRGRASDQRFGTGRWTSKSRQRPRLYPASTVGSSRNSLEDPQSSIWTPSASSTWSKYSFGRTQTSMSVESFASSFPEGEYQRSIGFANALSQAIIREETAGTEQADDTMRAAPLLEDESLELAGAPWAKEGILKHKRHLDSVDRKAKDRNWVENFAVIEKGCMRLFSFSMNAKSMRQKMKSQKLSGVVGGGNWMDNAEALGNFSLRQTIASALPPPGYSKTRPHVWALSLPTGAVHLFQVGTPEIVKEFVTTANYWSARLSKEPLVGAVSNIEYGWGESVINSALIHTDNIPSTSVGNARPSLQSSIRSSLDQGSSRPKLPGDKVTINDWKPPQQSMVASVLMEVDQLKALSTYVKNIEEELQKHNELRPAMLLAFSPRHTNSTKAMANWERKSSYLLREIVKFTTYVDCLLAAQAQKEKIYSERKVPTLHDTKAIPDKEAEENVKAPETLA